MWFLKIFSREWKVIKMRISFIGTKGMNFGNSAFGGFETVVTELAPRLVVAGHTVTIYCRKNLYTTNNWPREVRGVRLKFVGSIETKNLGTMTNSFLSILDAIRDRVDAVLLFNLGLGIFVPLLKLFGIKVITHLDGIEWERGKWGRLAKSTFQLGAFLNVKLADELIADAMEIQRIYLERFHRQPIMISYGAEVRNDHDPETIQEFGLSVYSYYLLVTRFVPENNPLFIIQNYLQSQSQRPLVVLGKNYYNSAYESEIRKIDDPRVLFLGHVADRKSLYEFYKYSYCYIHGHSVGGTNPTMLEALANSCCVLALNTPFNKEMLGNGEFGRFFDLEADDFVEQLDFLDAHAEIVAALREKAITRVTTYYNWESVTESYLKLFDSIRE